MEFQSPHANARNAYQTLPADLRGQTPEQRAKRLEPNVIQKLFFPILLSIIQWVVSFSIVFILRAQSWWKSVFKSVTRRSSLSQTEQDIARQCQVLTKRPQHISFAVLEDNISYYDLAKLIIWCIDVGAEYISVYDVAGQIKSNQDKLLLALNKVRVSDFSNVRLHWHDHTNISPLGRSTNGNGNGRHRREVHISLLSAADGRPDIVRTARRLAHRVKVGEIDAEAIDEQLVSESLSTNRGMPDPDLLVRLGMTESNMGFLPWQIRLTEIHRMNTHKGVEFEEFFRVLMQFSKCEQRFGT